MNLLRTKLDNGLNVLIRESHTAPVASCWLWYRVGNRNERPGLTGASHWVEHMLYKGTERWPEGKADQSINRVGGVFNGMTWFDFTAYYETLPVERISIALDIESDRMRNVPFDPEKFTAERSVIISERQGHENSPMFRLQEALMQTAYQQHPYRHSVVGNMADLQALTCDDLYAHYQTYYTPNNATIAIAGAFNAGEIERITERYFENIPLGDAVPPVTTVEPPQTEERRVVVEGAAMTDYFTMAYHAPSVQDKDFFALTVLSAVLSGGSGFLVGGGLTNYTSRLYRALVDTEMTIDVHGSAMPTVDPGLYQISATVWPGRSPADVETALKAEIAQMQAHVITTDELEKARRQARALFAYSSESITNQAFWLGFSEIFADYAWFMRYLDNLDAVTAADVQRVAQTYLQPENCTVGQYLGKA